MLFDGWIAFHPHEYVRIKITDLLLLKSWVVWALREEGLRECVHLEFPLSPVLSYWSRAQASSWQESLSPSRHVCVGRRQCRHLLPPPPPAQHWHSKNNQKLISRNFPRSFQSVLLNVILRQPWECPECLSSTLVSYNAKGNQIGFWPEEHQRGREGSGPASAGNCLLRGFAF